MIRCEYDNKLFSLVDFYYVTAHRYVIDALLHITHDINMNNINILKYNKTILVIIINYRIIVERRSIMGDGEFNINVDSILITFWKKSYIYFFLNLLITPEQIQRNQMDKLTIEMITV